MPKRPPFPPFPPPHPWPASPPPHDEDDEPSAHLEPDISEQATGLLVVPAGRNILFEAMIVQHQRDIARLSGWRKRVHERLEQATDPVVCRDLQRSLRMLCNEIEAHHRAVIRLRAQRDPNA